MQMMQAPPTSSLPRGTVTLLFTDIEGSTQLARRFEDGYSDLLAKHRERLRQIFAAHDGSEVDTQGDAFFVAFERAHDAVDAAAEVQRTLVDGEVQVRIGIHTGEPRLVEGHYYVGVDLSRAARICAAAHGGQVLLSSTTQDLVADTVKTRELGEHLLKGIEAPERLHQLVAPGLRDRFPPPRAASPGNLPRTRTPFFGRRTEVEHIHRLVTSGVAVITLTGPGGVGKTRLAIEAARQLRDSFADGTFFVQLAAKRGVDVFVVLAEIFDVEEQPGQPIRETLCDHLRERELLLVLDNFETVPEAGPGIAELVNTCPRMSVLVTSRERLHLRVEHEYRIEPLVDRDARELFVACAAATRSDFETDAGSDEVAAICDRLDRLPLAIELAASRARILPLATILERLDERLSFLTGGSRDLPERQRTLVATLDWSFELLDPVEQNALLSLAVFTGGASLEAVERVVSPRRGLELVTSLRDKSLLFNRAGDDGTPRFTMLATIREYALARLGERKRLNDARRRHADYFIEVAEAAEPEIQGPQQAEVLRQLAAEHDNFRSALAWAAGSGEGETSARLVAALWRFWFVRGHQTEGRRWIAVALEGMGIAPRTRARVLRGAATLDAVAGELESARRSASERLEVCRGLGDDAQIANALVGLANIEAARGDPDRAADLYEQASGHARRAGARPELASVMSNIGYLALLREDPATALPTCREAAALFEELGYGEEAAGAWLNEAAANLLLDDQEAAAASLLRSLDRYLDLQHVDGISYCLDAAAAVSERSGDTYRAALLTGAAEAARARTGTAVPPLEERLRLDTLARIAAAIDPSTYDEARAQGAKLGLEAAAATARLVAQTA